MNMAFLPILLVQTTLLASIPEGVSFGFQLLAQLRKHLNKCLTSQKVLVKKGFRDNLVVLYSSWRQGELSK